MPPLETQPHGLIHVLCAAVKAWLAADEALEDARIEVQSAIGTLQPPVLLVTMAEADPVFSGEPILQGTLQMLYHYEADVDGQAAAAKAVMQAVTARMEAPAEDDPDRRAWWIAAAAPEDPAENVKISWQGAATVAFTAQDNVHIASWSADVVFG